MNNPYLNQTAPGTTADVAIDSGLRAHMLRIYNYMASAVLLSGIVSYLIVSSPALTNLLIKSPLRWAFVLAPLAFVLVMSWRFERMSKTALQGLYWAYAVCIGVSFATILYVYTGTSVARAFFMAAGLFAGLSLYGYTTKADLSKIGTLLMVGMVVVFIASIVNIFLGSSGLQWAISLLGVLIFAGLTAYDTQKIKEMYFEGHGPEMADKLSIYGALTLYMDFLGMFQMLLSLLGNRE